ncbi:MAG: MBL fold metallo-hydrolase [Fibrobacterota bacterium]
MKYKKFTTDIISSNTYLIYNSETKSGFLIDPSEFRDDINNFIRENSIEIKFIAATHSHPDHIYHASKYAENYRVPFFMHKNAEFTGEFYNAAEDMIGLKNTKFPANYTGIDNKFTLVLDKLRLNIIHTPGHSPCSCCFICDDLMITGDTILENTIGRTDLPGGNKKEMKSSLEKICRLEGNYKILPGHGDISDLEHERKTNFFLEKASAKTGIKT